MQPAQENKDSYYKAIPRSRIASFDVYAVGQQKHHISALLECDVTLAREKLKLLKSSGTAVSFTAWLLKVISNAIVQHRDAASFMVNKQKLVIFIDVNISLLVEKDVDGAKVPIPLLILKTNEKSITGITHEIKTAMETKLTAAAGTVVINEKPKTLERLYYHLPGFLRRSVWRVFLRYPGMAYRRMGNVAVTSVGMMGRINGWFIHRSIHPISFGIGSVIKKPVVINDQIMIREMLNMTILMDHDVIDGAPMARFVKYLVSNIEKASGLE